MTTAREIVLIRHGRSTHEQSGWLDVDGLRRWMVAYDAAEIALHHPPPQETVRLAAGAGLLVASDLPRAIASARVLAPERAFETSPLLREVALESDRFPLPRFYGARLPFRLWGLIYGARWLLNSWRGAPPPGVDDAALARVSEAAKWLGGLSESHGTVAVVTHATFRSLLAKELVAQGWRGPEKRPFAEWSAWGYIR